MLLNQVPLRTHLSKITLLGYILSKCLTMNNIINKVISAGDKSMPEINLGHFGFIHSSCELFTKTKKIYKVSKEQETLNISIEMN